ncbi:MULTISPECIES: glutamine amidotransferase [Rhizobium]|uniref:glutamine amidotransferase n=1 Tax=Rhizobium TaxID=379 RepID=UPI001FEEBFF7|nr:MULTISPECIES: glutamine amidotransferase [Rhizobium]
MIRRAPIVVVQAGRPPAALRDLHGEQPDWFKAALCERDSPIMVVRAHANEPLPEPGSFACAIITGSWSMVTDREDWSERLAEWTRMIVSSGSRLLGVCYGHQLIAHALGGEVDYHPNGREIGPKQIKLTDSGLQSPWLRYSPPSFSAFLTHEQSVLQLPEGATVLGRSQHDPHQIVSYGHNILTVQFHPEFTTDIMRACIEHRRDKLVADGEEVDSLLDSIESLPIPKTLINAFCGG